MSEHAQKPPSLRQRQLLKQRRQAALMRQARQQGQNPRKKRSVAKRPQLETGSVAPFPSYSRPQRLHKNLSPVATASNRKTLGQKSRSSQPRWIKKFLRLSLLGLGISALTGTALAILHPEPPIGTLATSKGQIRQVGSLGKLTEAQLSEGSALTTATAILPVLGPEKELKEAKLKIQALAAAQKDLVPGMFFYNLETGAYLDLGGDKSFAAASTIKLPVLVAFFQAIDAKQARLDETLTMRKDLVASESGVMQYQPPGSKFSALETVDKMITISDNTATNMMIDRLGGLAALNQRFKTWGLAQTAIRSPLPDLQGTNTVSPKDLSLLMLKISQGDLLTPHSRDLVLDILRRTVTNTLLTPGLGEGATIAHKTGDIGSVVGDAGLIAVPNGQRYVATVMVQRPYNDPRAQELIRQISKITYGALIGPSVPTTTASTAMP